MALLQELKSRVNGLISLGAMGLITLTAGCPVAEYGPAPEYGAQPVCNNDQTCIEQMGDNWYCDRGDDGSTDGQGVCAEKLNS